MAAAAIRQSKARGCARPLVCALPARPIDTAHVRVRLCHCAWLGGAAPAGVEGWDQQHVIAWLGDLGMSEVLSIEASSAECVAFARALVAT